MNSTSRPASTGLRVALCAALLTMTSGALAQSPAEEDFEALSARITHIEELLQSLDDQAGECLNTTPAGDLDNPACATLLNAIDGEPIAIYLQHCRSLQSWRDHFISAYQDANTAQQNNNTERLHLLVQTEYYCADNSLTQRTENVVTAFNRLIDSRGESEPRADGSAQSSSTSSTSFSASPSARTGVQRMNERVHRETEQQWRSLELELLRQRLEIP